jgi:hypothetical protein
MVVHFMQGRQPVVTALAGNNGVPATQIATHRDACKWGAATTSAHSTPALPRFILLTQGWQGPSL